MKEDRLTLVILEEIMAIGRLDKDEFLPVWAVNSNFFSITRTEDEISIVCAQANFPKGIKLDQGWRCLKVEGPLDFSLTGILTALANPLAKSGISIFAISTYDTDYLLVKQENLEKTVEVLSQEGHQIKKQVN